VADRLNSSGFGDAADTVTIRLTSNIEQYMELPATIVGCYVYIYVYVCIYIYIYIYIFIYINIYIYIYIYKLCHYVYCHCMYFDNGFFINYDDPETNSFDIIIINILHR
jgi:hypothetical protein